MSTSFKKPSKKTFRRKQNSGSGDEEEKAKSTTEDRGEAPPEVTSASNAAPASKYVEITLDEEIEKHEVVQPLKSASSKLSFEDEEDESEEFQVKKSNRSRKIAQKLKEEWKGSQQKETTENFQNMKISGFQQVTAPKDETPEILLGDDVDDAGLHDYRPPGAVHSRGGIPDSKQIALAKKKREEARKGEEYVPLDVTERVSDNKSRLVREDDNDLSDEDAEIIMPSTSGNYLGSRRKEEELRQRNRDFYELDERMAQTLEESDDEIQRWEEAQLRKGVTLPQIQALSEEMNKPVDLNSYQQYMYTPQYDETTYQPEGYSMNPSGHYTSVSSTVEEVRRKIKNRMELAKEQQRRHTLDLEKVNSDLEHCNKSVGSLTLELESASFEYKFYQEVRGFVWDVVDCYNSKLPQIANAENELLASWKKTHQARVDSRQQYIKDKSDDISGKTCGSGFVGQRQAYQRTEVSSDGLLRTKEVVCRCSWDGRVGSQPG
ncbi:hypothetical protein RvY_16015-2 [Ramazzottius varieornatus]|uniref:Uncharacterized protein n=1 Tax=Ramazzottius varieornatus TaxID=947166 RepID=A0A1D1VWY6_RAMVA|nr:hypothetical protein RvY_16015-2 [Ramazzottius varieornatus]